MRNQAGSPVRDLSPLPPRVSQKQLSRSGICLCTGTRGVNQPESSRKISISEARVQRSSKHRPGNGPCEQWDPLVESCCTSFGKRTSIPKVLDSRLQGFVALKPLGGGSHHGLKKQCQDASWRRKLRVYLRKIGARASDSLQASWWS